MEIKDLLDLVTPKEETFSLSRPPTTRLGGNKVGSCLITNSTIMARVTGEHMMVMWSNIDRCIKIVPRALTQESLI
jgi:hypothetical protein